MKSNGRQSIAPAASSSVQQLRAGLRQKIAWFIGYAEIGSTAASFASRGRAKSKLREAKVVMDAG
jgi:hypothetical protein